MPIAANKLQAMKITLLTTALFLVLAGYSQTDSLEIKLQQYKKLYDGGLITQAEYEILKARVLQINTAPAAKEQPIPATQRPDDVCVIVGPVLFGDVEHKVSPQQYTNSLALGNMAGVGINLQLGANIKRRYFPTISLGLEGSKRRMLVPLGACFNMNILKGKVTPHFHVGLGYLYQRFSNGRSPSPGQHGMYAGAGFGFSVYVSKRIYLTFSPDYRLLFYKESNYDLPSYIPRGYGVRYYSNTIHQLGGRIQVAFM